jgi:hypothetical protein
MIESHQAFQDAKANPGQLCQYRDGDGKLREVKYVVRSAAVVAQALGDEWLQTDATTPAATVRNYWYDAEVGNVGRRVYDHITTDCGT